MYLFSDYYSLSLFLGGVIALISGLIVYLNNSRQKMNIFWMMLNIATAIWSFGYLILINSVLEERAIIANWVLHAAATFIPILYSGFIFHLTGLFKKHKKSFYTIFFLGVIFGLLVPFDILNGRVTPKLVFGFAPNAGPLYGIFTAYFFGSVVYTLLVLLREAMRVRRREGRLRYFFVFFSSLAGFMGGGSVFFLTFNVMLYPYPIVLFALYPLIIAYAIVRHKLFELKVATVEVLTFALWVLLLMRVLLSNTVQEQIINGFIFIVSVIIGALLIQSVLKEIKAREETERLAESLRIANAQLRELDRQKSEFVSIASHQLRTPLTAIKGYSSMLLDGSFGKLCKGTTVPVEKIYRSSQQLVGVVEDFLNVTRIEQGRMQYDFAPVDMHYICENVIEELSLGAKDKGLDLVFKCGEPGAIVPADEGKIRQVALNLVDNAVKYTEKGEVQVCLEDDDSKHIIFKVTDTGIGIPKSFKKHMFEKFSRAENSGLHHANGSGIGLYIVKEIVEAHKGTISVDSKEGKGTTFTVVLPRVKEETKKKT